MAGPKTLGLFAKFFLEYFDFQDFDFHAGSPFVLFTTESSLSLGFYYFFLFSLEAVNLVGHLAQNT